MTDSETNSVRVADIISDAGGTIIGKTRLQKIAFFLELAGLGSGYKFTYHYYGPFSESLEKDANIAWAFDQISRSDQQSSWGGKYTVYSVDRASHEHGARQHLASLAASIDAVELELAATAALLKVEGFDDPWRETRNRKPDKATPVRVRSAKTAYRSLMGIVTPRPLPDIL